MVYVARCARIIIFALKNLLFACGATGFRPSNPPAPHTSLRVSTSHVIAQIDRRLTIGALGLRQCACAAQHEMVTVQRDRPVALLAHHTFRGGLAIQHLLYLLEVLSQLGV